MTELQTPMRIETEVKLPKERNQNLNLSKSASTPSNISSATLNTDEPLKMDNQPTESVSGEQPTAKQGKMTSIKLEKNQMSDMLAPLSSMWHRATEAATSVSGTIHPVMPDLNNVKENIKATLNQPPTEGGALSDNPNPETLKKQATSLYALTLVPALMTFYRVLGGNGGPTWFSLHPVFMMISILSMLTGLLLQRYGGQKNITLIGTLTVASIVSMCLSLFAVWSAKETYAKVHFLSMHSHFGGMTIGGLLAYVIGVWYCFDPITGTERADRKWQQYLVTLGKGTATLAMCSQLAGVIEVERTWTFLFLWMGTLLMLTPFVVLPWNK